MKREIQKKINKLVSGFVTHFLIKRNVRLLSIFSLHTNIKRDKHRKHKEARSKSIVSKECSSVVNLMIKHIVKT